MSTKVVSNNSRTSPAYQSGFKDAKEMVIFKLEISMVKLGFTSRQTSDVVQLIRSLDVPEYRR